MLRGRGGADEVIDGEVKWPVGLSDSVLCDVMGEIRRAWLDGTVLSNADRAVIEFETGYLGRHLDSAIARAFQPFSPSAVLRMIELGRSRCDRKMAFVLAILAGRIPALAVNVLFSAIAAHTPVLFRAPGGAGSFVKVLVRSVAGLAPELAGAFGVTSVASNTPELDAIVARAPGVLAYGSDAVIARIESIRPNKPTWPGEHRESIVVAFAEHAEVSAGGDWPPSLARAIAWDVAIYNQGGCLSPHVLLVEGPEQRAVELSKAVHDELLVLARRWPVATPSLSSAALQRLFVSEMRSLTARDGGLVLTQRSVSPAVIIQTSPYRPGPGGRVLQVIPFSAQTPLKTIIPTLEGRLQGVAVHGPFSRWRDLVRLNPSYLAPYVCKPGHLQRPPAVWRENGRRLVSEFAALCP